MAECATSPKLIVPKRSSAVIQASGAAGTTVRAAQHYLALFNPFGDDAILDIAFLTDTGVQQIDRLQGFVVPRRSRVTVPVHQLLERQNLVAVEIRNIGWVEGTVAWVQGDRSGIAFHDDIDPMIARAPLSVGEEALPGVRSPLIIDKRRIRRR